MLSVPIITDVVSSNLDQVRGVQHYVIKFVRELRQVGGFLRNLRFPLPIELTPRYNWNIVESGVKHLQANKQYINLFDDTLRSSNIPYVVHVGNFPSIFDRPTMRKKIKHIGQSDGNSHQRVLVFNIYRFDWLISRLTIWTLVGCCCRC
jgi:hypothetical protein